MEQQPQNPSLFQLNIDANSAATLRSTAAWAKILGICGMIFAILCIISGFLTQNALRSSQYDNYGYRSNVNTSTLGNIGLAVYVVLGIILLLSSIFALTCGNKISAGLRTNDSNALRAGFSGARNYFALWAILMIIFLVLVIIGIATSLGRGGGA